MDSVTSNPSLNAGDRAMRQPWQAPRRAAEIHRKGITTLSLQLFTFCSTHFENSTALHNLQISYICVKGVSSLAESISSFVLDRLHRKISMFLFYFICKQLVKTRLSDNHCCNIFIYIVYVYMLIPAVFICWDAVGCLLGWLQQMLLF